jgi:hypothetical protein
MTPVINEKNLLGGRLSATVKATTREILPVLISTDHRLAQLE